MGRPHPAARPAIPIRPFRIALASFAVLSVLAPGVASAHAPAPPYAVVWRVDLPSAASAPAIAGTTAVLVARDAVVGVDTGSGEIAWSVPRAGGALLRPAIGYVDGEAVVVYVERRASGATGASPTADPSPGSAAAADLVAIDLDDRSERWRVAFDAGLPGGVLAWGANAYVVAGDGTLTAVALDDGTTAWEASSVGAGDAPAVGVDDVIYVAGRGAPGPARIAAFDAATGERLWAKSPDTGAPTTSAIAVGGDVVAYAGSDRLLHVLDRATGDERWTALLGNLPSPYVAPLVVDDGVVVVDLSGTVSRFDLASGERVWSFPLNDLVVRSTPIAAESTMVLGTNEGRLVTLDLGTGRLVASVGTGEGLLGGIAVPEHILVVTKGGAEPALLAFDTDTATPLLDVASPTEVDPAGLLGRFAIAALAALVVIAVPPRVAAWIAGRRRRSGGGPTPEGPTDAPDEGAS